MARLTERIVWTLAFGVIVALAVPWFLWRDATVAYGLPLWVWWHIGWLVVTSITFYAFSQRAWGTFVEVGQ